MQQMCRATRSHKFELVVFTCMFTLLKFRLSKILTKVKIYYECGHYLIVSRIRTDAVLVDTELFKLNYTYQGNY